MNQFTNSVLNRATRNVSAAVLLAFAILAAPAHAADPVFPTGSLIGLVPPGDMTPSKTIQGFTDVQSSATILMTTLPAAAYDYLDKSELPEVLRKPGTSITIEKREPVEFDAGKGFLIIGTERMDKTRYRKWLLVLALHDLTALVSVEAPEEDAKYSDKVLRAALATLTQRASVPDTERLSLLPFTIGDRAGFRIGDVLPGRAVMLVDAPDEHDTDASTAPWSEARLLIAALPGGPVGARRARRISRAWLSIRSAASRTFTFRLSEPLRIGSQPGFQTLAKAKGCKTDTDIMVVQWLRFGSGAFMQMIGIGARRRLERRIPAAAHRARQHRSEVSPRIGAETDAI